MGSGGIVRTPPLVTRSQPRLRTCHLGHTYQVGPPAPLVSSLVEPVRCLSKAHLAGSQWLLASCRPAARGATAVCTTAAAAATARCQSPRPTTTTPHKHPDKVGQGHPASGDAANTTDGGGSAALS